MKKCKRNKGQLGLMLGLGAASILANLGTSIATGAANKKANDIAKKAEQLNMNMEAYNQNANSLQQALNSAIDTPNNNIHTLASAMKCGGKKRVKKCGGGRAKKLYGGDFISKCI